MVNLQETIELYNMKFNEKIKTLRKSANLNQQELASKLHIHVTHLSKIENGHLLPSIDIVQRLMKVFAVSADNLLNDEENSVVELVQNPEQTGHPFRTKADSDSGTKRTLIPEQNGQ